MTGREGPHLHNGASAWRKGPIEALISMDERARRPVEPSSGVRQQAIAAFGRLQPGEPSG